MATGLQVYSKTAASNANADSNQNWAEGMAPSQVNDSARAGMASLALWRDDNSGSLVTAGSSTAFTVTTNQVEAALTSGYTVTVQFHATADTSATLNVDGLGAKPMQLYAGTNLSGSEYVAGAIRSFTYSSTGTGQWIAKDHAQLANNSVTLPKVATTGGNPAFGFDMPVNLQLNASVSSNLLTIAVKTNSGNDPSTADPVYIPFRDPTIANGDPVWIKITSALSISTFATGATLGSQNNLPFRFWILAFANGTNAVLALWHSGAGASSTAINPLNEGVLQSTTGISGTATAAGTFYTPNGTTLSNKAFRILAYLDYSAGLSTAGTYASAPTIIQLFGPGVKKPGEVIQTQTATGTSLGITGTAPVNLLRIYAVGYTTTGSAGTVTMAIKQGSTQLAAFNYGTAAGGNFASAATPFLLLATSTSTSLQTISLSGTNCTANAASIINVDEIMG